MQFVTVKALIAWAFQMSEAVPVKTSKYEERTGVSFGGMSAHELKNMAADVLAKIGRLPREEQVVLVSRFTDSTKAINEAAELLPRGWPVALRRELARAWADNEQLARSQQDIGTTFMLSQPTVYRRWAEARRCLNGYVESAVKVLELQLLSLVEKPSHYNSHRHNCKAA